MILTTKRFLFLGVLLLSVQLSRADVPDGTFTFTLGETNSPVYDLTGGLQLNQTLIGSGGTEVGLYYGITLTQDARGFFTGSGETLVQIGDNDFVAAAYSVRGKIRTVGDGTHATLVVRLRGEDVIAGILTPFSISIVYELDVSAENGDLEGRARGTANFGRLGRSKVSATPVSVSLPTSGGWTLQMTIVPLSRLAGTALVILPNGRTFQAHLSGRFADEQSVIRISGFAEGRGNSATIIFTTDNEVTFLRGRILGQVVTQ
jgi:hypothetical protein